MVSRSKAGRRTWLGNLKARVASLPANKFLRVQIRPGGMTIDALRRWASANGFECCVNNGSMYFGVRK